ncbi:hypothetical protein BS78_03G060800 [Paspalum vaginatum]|nr:hypothetical protein BS78_03G060800 [Paspalum vaginatum]
MRVMLQARGLWIAVTLGTNDVTEDRMALEVLAKAIPAEMMGTIASKPTAKVAWDAIKVMNVGVERVRKAKAGTLRRDFDALKFRDGESVDDFGIRINHLVNQLAVLGDGIREEEVVRKFLQALSARFEQIASSIETLLDLSDVSVEELIGRLKATEERHNHGGANSIASLNLTEDELVARLSSRLQLSGGGGGNSDGGGSECGSNGGGSECGKEPASGQKRGRGRGCGGSSGRGGGNASRDGGNVARDECRYCGKKGHWAWECRKKKRDNQAHVAQVEEEGEGEQLLVATATVHAASSSTPVPAAAAPIPNPPGVHIDEPRVFVQLCDKEKGDRTRWILDTGATNHMTVVRAAFSELDTNVRGSVRFGDGSAADIEGRGTVLLRCRTGEHRALSGVYHIPQLTANIFPMNGVRTSTPAPALSMKLLVDTTAQRVLYAEASKDVVDFLFSLLTLPVGTVVKILSKDAMVGSIGNLYGSVEKLDETYVRSADARGALLAPAGGFDGGKLLQLPESSEPSVEFYRCYYSNYSHCQTYMSKVSGTRCQNNSCSDKMTTKMIQVVDSSLGEAAAAGAEQPGPGHAGKGFVQGVVTYTVMDDLKVAPMSTISGITLLSTFGITDIGMLQEKTVQLDYEQGAPTSVCVRAQGLKILKALLQSNTVLTDVFLVKKSSKA